MTRSLQENPGFAVPGMGPGLDERRSIGQEPAAGSATCGARLRASHRRPGFTLIEVMVSVTILATMMAIMWGAFHNSFRLRDVVTRNTERTQAIHASLRRMQREISMAFVTKIGQTPTNEQGDETYITAFIGDSDRLDFANFAHLRTRVGEAASEQAEIAYYLRSNRDSDGRLRQDLVRREQAPIDEDPEEGGFIYTLLEDVKSIEFEYWRPDREIAGDAWEREWDSRDPEVQSLPPKVRITIEVPHPIRIRETMTFSVQAEIHLTQPIGFATQLLTPDQNPTIDPATGQPVDSGASGATPGPAQPDIDDIEGATRPSERRSEEDPQEGEPPSRRNRP